MKILWLAHAVPWPPKMGMLQRSYNLFEHASRSHELHLFVLNNRALIPDQEKLEIAIRALQPLCAQLRTYSFSADRSFAHRAALFGRAALSRKPYEVHWLRNGSLYRDLESVTKSQSFDVIHLDSLGLWQYARACGDAPVALTHHDIESHKLSRRAQREPNFAKRLYLHNEAQKMARFERQICPHAGVNIVVSSLDADRLRKIAGTVRICVVDNGVDVDYFRPAPRIGASPYKLIFVGGMNYYANREAALFLLEKVWPALIEDGSDWSITFIGRDPPAKLVAASRDPRVTVTGFADDVRPHIDAAAIYVCPIFDGGGTRVKVLDALAMAKPLIAPTVCVEGLDLEPGRDYLNAETAEEFVSQIRRLAADDRLRAHLAENGRRVAEFRFSWDAIAVKLETAYRQAIESRSTQPASRPRDSDGAQVE